jgi:hypothetical protein
VTDEMNDDHVMGLTPADEDPELHRIVAGLPSAEPPSGLEDRVLSHVRRPASARVRRMQAAGRELVASGRIWMIVGGLALGSLLPLSAMFVTARLFSHEIGAAFSTGVAGAGSWLTTTVSAQTVSLIETGRAYLAGLGLAGSTWAGIGSGTAVLTVCCGWGLYRTMTPRLERGRDVRGGR